MTPTEARVAAAKFAPPRPHPQAEPVLHWHKVRAVLASGPMTYSEVAAALNLNRWHANTLMRRLRFNGLVDVARAGVKGKRGHATAYRIAKAFR